MSVGTWEMLENLRWEVFHWRRTTSLPVKLILSLFGTGFIALAAQVKIPLPWTPVPITGQTFAVLLTGVLLGANGGALSSFLYLLSGTLGVPWFAGGTGGWSVLAGPTGGYILGFIIAAYFLGYLTDHYPWVRSLPGIVLVMLFANFVLIHGPGLLWLAHVTGTWHWKEVLMLGSLPFIPGDLVKIAAVSVLARAVLPQQKL